MNKAENLSELATAYNLAKNPVSALELHLAYETKLIALRRYLLLELREPGIESRIALPYRPRDVQELIPMLTSLYASKRAERGLKPLSIIY